ncbi:MAG: hypothetical protein ABI895_41170 [Deltaproteobacteria bacterium]
MQRRRLDRKVTRYLVLASALAGACGAPAEDDDPDSSDTAAARAGSSGSGALGGQGPVGTNGTGGSSGTSSALPGPPPGSGGSPRSSAGAGGAPSPGPAASSSDEPAGGSGGAGGSSSAAASGSGGGGNGGGGAAEPSVSFEQDILPVLRANCGSCHASGFLPRFASSDVDIAFSVAEAQSQRMVALLADGDMPPACAGRAPGGRGCVSADDFSLIQDWVEAGTPR